MKFLPLLTIFVGLIPAVLAAFGVTESGNNYLVDSGGGLVTTINRSNGDITSLVFNGKQLQDSSKFTHLSSGLGSATVSSSVANNIAKITIVSGSITHYYIVRSGINTLYIGTYASAEPAVGELRFIARLSKAALPNGVNFGGVSVAEINGGTAIEGEDVFNVGGQTRSKFYSSVRFLNDQVHGVTGSGVGAFIIVPSVSYETSSGGPFFRDINDQGSAQQELYWYMNSNHHQTEAYRTGFFGPYALAITTGSAPSASLDTSFLDSLGLQGYVPSSGRGTISGSYSNTLSGIAVTIGFKNSAAQYWISAGSGPSGSFSRNLVKPGTYTVTLYQGELAVATGSASVSAGGTSSVTLTAASRPTTIWSIGTVDGTPAGFLNADKIERMHPSDSRMSAWGPVTFTVGSSSVGSFPLAQFKSVNSPTTVKWTASSSQIGARTLRIRTTQAFAGGRPQITVNSWTSAAPSAPTDVGSRGITRGTWRGNNQVYDFAIPSGTLIAGTNTILINVASGSSGTTFLSPNFVYDSVELI